MVEANTYIDKIHYLDDSLGTLVKELNLKKLNLAADRKIIVFGTQPIFYEEAINPLQAILDLGREYPHFQLVIKVHPHEDLSRYQQFKDETTIPVQLIKNVNILKVIAICDLYVTQFSTTILDALALDKTVAIFNFDKKTNIFSFLRTNAILQLTTPQQIKEQIPQLLEDKNFQQQLASYRREYLFDQVYELDGNAAKRIVGAVMEKI